MEGVKAEDVLYRYECNARPALVYNLCTSAAICLIILLGMMQVFYVYEPVVWIRIVIIVLGLVYTGMLFGTLAYMAMLRASVKECEPLNTICTVQHVETPPQTSPASLQPSPS